MFNMLKDIFSKEQIKIIESSIIINTDNGYELYGEYFINRIDGYYVVSKYSTHLSIKFNKLKNAVIWTTMYKTNKIVEAKRIHDLDGLLVGTLTSMEIHLNQYKKATELETKMIAYAKLEEDRMKKQNIMHELEGYSVNAKIWQEKQFSQFVQK